LTDEGRQIDESDGHLENAPWPIRDSLELEVNATVDKNGHFEKHFVEILATEEGMHIALSQSCELNVVICLIDLHSSTSTTIPAAQTKLQRA
jgi:hypothetical protein